jgi:hypothetical protein
VGTISFLAAHGEELQGLIKQVENFIKFGFFNYQRFTASEMKEILSALASDFRASGHWYKCPNGHLYAIGECGGAMQQSVCNECGAVIGGTHHALVSDNSAVADVVREVVGDR